MKLNPNTKIVQQIREELKSSKGYCPCMLEQIEDTLCPCKDRREKEICICDLYVKN